MQFKRNMLVYFLGKLIPAGAVFFIMIFGMRFLGKSEFGKYNLLFNCINISVALFIGWIQQSMLRFTKGDEKGNDYSRKQFIKYSFFASILASASIFLLSILYFEQSIWNSFLIGSFTFVLSMFMAHLTNLQSRFRSNEYAVTESLFYLITIAILSVIIFRSPDHEYILFYIAWLIAGSIWILIELLTSRRIIMESFRLSFDSGFFRKSLQYGFLITSWLFISNLFNVVDRFIIRHYFDFEKVGVYSVVYDFIYRLTSFAAMPILLTLHPLIMKTWNESNKKGAMLLINKALFILSALMVAELIAYFIFGNWIFQTFFHLETNGLLILIVPLIISSVLWQAALFLHKPLELLFKQRQMIVGVVISLLSNILLNILFIPKFGFEAAAYTTLASTVIYIGYVLFSTPSKKNILL